jgi:hypothetical protein
MSNRSKHRYEVQIRNGGRRKRKMAAAGVAVVPFSPHRNATAAAAATVEDDPYARYV